jgi:F-type H+-transporting ATPase subunit alpha
VRELREYLKTNCANYIETVQGEKQLSEESEAVLKTAINEVKASLLAVA